MTKVGTENSETNGSGQIEQELQQHNDEITSRQYCKICRTSVRERDYSYKYAAAGGALVGPFCSRQCYWKFLTGDEDD